MARNYSNPTNQIVKVQTNKNLIAFYDKLNPVTPNSYAQLHAKGEDNTSGGRDYSLIGITLQDYSAGSGQNNVIVNFNLEPEQLQFILTRLTAGFPEYEFSQTKIYGAPDNQGYSIASQISIVRKPLDNNGQPLRMPWRITISNGRGVRMQNSNGGFYMKGGSFVKDKTASISVSDMDMYMLLKRVDSYINQWENMISANLITEGRRLVSEQRAKANEQRQTSGYQNNYANNYSVPQPQNQPQAQPQYGYQYYNAGQNAEPQNATPPAGFMPEPVGYSVGSMGIPDGFAQ